MTTEYRDPKVAAPAATPAAAHTGTPPSARSAYSNPMAAGQRRSADEIESDIEATRARIEARLEGLSAQTAPARLLETTLGADLSSPSATIETLYLRAKSNPISAALIAAGLAALYLGRRTEDPVAIARARREAELEAGREVPGPATRDAAERVAYDIAALKGQARAVGDDISSATTRLTSSAASTRDSTTSSVNAATQAAASTAESVKAQAKNTYEDVSERVGEAYEGAVDAIAQAPDYARRQARYAGSWVQENPVAAGLIGVAAGAVAASVFATSRAKSPRVAASQRANRDLYRKPDGYSTSEELQAYSTRRTTPSSTANVRRTSLEAGTRAAAAARAPSPASSMASQGARRAAATASETVDRTVTTAPSSTVAKTTATRTTAAKSTVSKSKSAGSKTPARPVTASTGAAERPSTGGRSSGTAAKKTGGTAPKNTPSPSAAGTSYTESPSKGGSKTPKK